MNLREPFVQKTKTRAGRLSTGRIPADSRAFNYMKHLLQESLSRHEKPVPKMSGGTSLDDVFDSQRAFDLEQTIFTARRRQGDDWKKELQQLETYAYENIPYILNGLIRCRDVADLHTTLFQQLRGRKSQTLQGPKREACRRVYQARFEAKKLSKNYQALDEKIKELLLSTPGFTPEECLRQALGMACATLYLIGNPKHEPRTYLPDIAWYQASSIGNLLKPETTNPAQQDRLALQYFSKEDLEALASFDAHTAQAAQVLARTLRREQHEQVFTPEAARANTIQRYSAMIESAIPGSSFYTLLHLQDPTQVREHLDRIQEDPASHAVAAYIASLHYALDRRNPINALQESLMNLSDLIPFHDDTYRLRVGHLADDLAEREAQAHRIMNDYQNGDREKALKQLRDFSQVPLDLVPIFDQRVQAALHRAQYA